jgi:hypothetical protein
MGDVAPPSSPPPRSALFRLVLLGVLVVALVASLVGGRGARSHRTGHAGDLQTHSARARWPRPSSSCSG